jgi:hypothetical protein
MKTTCDLASVMGTVKEGEEAALLYHPRIKAYCAIAMLVSHWTRSF